MKHETYLYEAPNSPLVKAKKGIVVHEAERLCGCDKT